MATKKKTSPFASDGSARMSFTPNYGAIKEILRVDSESRARTFFEKKIVSNSLPIDSIKRGINRHLRALEIPISQYMFLSHLKELVEQHRALLIEQKDSGFYSAFSNLYNLLAHINIKMGEIPVTVDVSNLPKPKKERTKIFVSYSHSDIGYLNDVKRHFKPFLKGIDYWDDTRIKPGDKWKKEIEKAISETKVAILLVSTDFFGSDFIETEELPPLLEAAEKDGAVILTLIVKPCLFEEFPLLNQYQAMNPPSRPVSKMDENEREELFVNLVRQTKKVLDAKPGDDE